MNVEGITFGKEMVRKSVIFIVAAIVMSSIAFFSYGFLKCLTSLSKRRSECKVERVLTGHELREHKRLLKKHGLDEDISAVEITDKGLFFHRNGKRCRFI